MTLSTTYGNMGSRQWKSTQIVVKLRRRPCRRGMASHALVGQLQLFMVRIVRRRVIRLMTRPALGRRVLELSVHVTLRAVDGNVCARQRETRIGVIER